HLGGKSRRPPAVGRDDLPRAQPRHSVGLDPSGAAIARVPRHPDGRCLMNADYAGLFQAMRPEAHLVIGALLVLTIDMIWARHRPANRHHVALVLGLVSLLTAGYAAATGGASGAIY